MQTPTPLDLQLLWEHFILNYLKKILLYVPIIIVQTTVKYIKNKQ
jgi:hypothetical protein